MHSPTKSKLVIYSSFLWVSHCYCFDFDQNYFGVQFSPFVKNFSEKPASEYTYNDIKTMVTLASQKFSKFLVKDTIVHHDYYLPNFTYYHGSYAGVYAGTIIALINKGNYNGSMSIIYQLEGTTTVRKAGWDISVALEAVEKANNIFPGTVEGISLYGYGDLQQTLNQLQTFRSQASALGIKLGTEPDCHEIRRRENETLYKIFRNIVQAADFIICSAMVNPPNAGAEKYWPSLHTTFMSFKHIIGRINSSVEVMARTMWPSSGLNKFHNVENFRRYWEMANSWAVENQYRIYLVEAFDIPNRNPQRDRHWGWWKLKPNAEIDSVDGYVEKFSEPTLPTTTSASAKKEDNITAEMALPTMISTTIRPTTTNGAEDMSNEFVSTTPLPNENISEDNGVPVNDHGDKFDIHDLFKNWSDTTYIVLATIGVICVILLINAIVIILCFRRKKHQPATAEVMSAQDVRDFILGTVNENDANSLKGSETAADNAIKFPYDNSLEISKENIKIDHKHELGSGEFGSVLKAIIEMSGAEAVEVAIKVAKQNSQLTALKGLLSEIKIMTYLGKHPNIVTLKGAYTAELSKGCVYVATELCNLGSLESFLRKNQNTGRERSMASNSEKKSDEMRMMEVGSNPEITFRDMVRWSKEIACGMEYIEQRQVIHADLATRNVLLSADKTAKISDFGLSRRMYNYLNYVMKNQEPLPWRWMAIESLKRMEFSSKSDVWSYGVTLWEIFSKGDTPYPGLSWTERFVSRLESGFRPNCPKFASPEIYNLMRDCWSFEPGERPTFTELVECVESLLPKSHVGECVPGRNVYLSMD